MHRSTQVSAGSVRTGARRNLLCLDQYASVGGGQRSLFDLLPAFAENGWNICAAICGNGPLPAALQKQGCRTYVLEAKHYSSTKKPPAELLRYALDLPRAIDALQRIVTQEGTTLLYVNGPRLLPAAAWAARKRRIPLVFHCHNRLFQRSAIALAGQSLRVSKASVIASCHYAAAPIRRYLAPERVKILYNGVQQIAPSKKRIPQTQWRIGVIGRVEKEKGQLEFVQAAKIVARQFPACRFFVIGSPLFSGLDYYERVRLAARDVDIEFLGWQSDIASIYSDVDLLVVPSGALEATTRVILEAFSAAIPVIAFPSGGIPEILEHERTGFLTTAPTAEALAGGIVAVLGMRSTYIDSIVAAAKDEWRRRFTLEAYRKAVIDLFTQAADEYSC